MITNCCAFCNKPFIDEKGDTKRSMHVKDKGEDGMEIKACVRCSNLALSFSAIVLKSYKVTEAKNDNET